MSESSLPSNPSQPEQDARHPVGTDASERQSLSDREETIQRLLADQTVAASEAFAAVDPQRLSASLSDLAGDAAPQAEDLVVLIQALNQCNSNLLARVGELEAELAKHQAELKAQKEKPSTSDDPTLRTELNAVKQKVMKLRQQMNTAHQANQSQRACIQSLRQNLADAEQKHAALSEAHTQLQTQFQEQSQRLAEAENTCRDLCLRLHRQQQYTLQFKAALKARAEANTPFREPGEPTASSMFETTRSPAVREIRPWSAVSASKASPDSEASAPSSPAATDLDRATYTAAVDSSVPSVEIAILPNPDVADASDSSSEDVGDRPPTIPSTSTVMPLDLPAFPSLQQLSVAENSEEPNVEAPAQAPHLEDSPLPNNEAAGAGSRPLAPISFDMKQDLPKWAKFSHVSLATEMEQDSGLQSSAIASAPTAAEAFGESSISDPWAAPEAEAPQRPEAQQTPASPLDLPSFSETIAPPLGMEQETPTPAIDLDPALLEQLDAAVRPLLDSVVDAIRGGEKPIPLDAIDTPEPDNALSESSVAPVLPTSSPHKPDLDRAEEDLWRDLAKLVDISTDDIIQASLSGDFDAFTSIDFDALRQSLKGEQALESVAGNQTDVTQPECLSAEPQPVSSTPAAAQSSDSRSGDAPFSAIRSFPDGLDLPFSNLHHDQADEASAEAAPAVERSPSPVVYPHRTPRKLPSIAAIDLPSFPRPQPS